MVEHHDMLSGGQRSTLPPPRPGVARSTMYAGDELQARTATVQPWNLGTYFDLRPTLETTLRQMSPPKSGHHPENAARF